MNLGGTPVTRCLHPGTALIISIVLWALMAGSAMSAAPVREPLPFKTPEAAAEALLAAFRDNDQAALTALFGSAYADRLLAKDKTDAREGRERLYQAAQKALTLRKDGEDRVVLVIGTQAWPFPIPLVRSGGEWRFQTAEGIEEVVNRRIGANEFSAISVCRDYLTAQRQYAAKVRDDSGVRKFARRLISSPGKQDGLYWDPALAGGEESPFGPLVAEYLAGGRQPRDPYHGYYFRILTGQGSRVPGGRYSYVINGNMIAGFALVAFPAEYGKTGIMTFLVSHHGKVFQKDLGPQTRKIAAKMQSYHPDSTWTEVKE
jgi:DNA-binding phage protein